MADVPTRICVFCSTTTGRSSSHVAAARSLAEALHSRNIKLVYGGGTTGMMGELAKALVTLSGPDAVQGYIPQSIISIERPGEAIDDPSNGVGEEVKQGWLARLLKSKPSRTSAEQEPTRGKVSSLLSEEEYGRTTVTKDLGERKRMMAKAVATGGPGSGFIGLSGGFGTMDELMEMATWRQYGVHKRGVCLYNVDGFWDGIMGWMEHALEAGFMREAGRDIMVSKDSAEDCIEWLADPKVDGGANLS